jgi:hypothetical protein
MIRFFWHSVFLLSEVENVSAYMRLDGDSCLSPVRKPLSQLFRDGMIYITNRDFIDQPFVCLHRWGDASLRYITFAIFAHDNMAHNEPGDWHFEHLSLRN